MRDEPEDPQSARPDASDTPPPPVFEAPHSNGAVHHNEPPRRTHAPWEFIILGLFVAILCIGIILGWTLVGSKSPEKLDAASAGQIAAACDHTQAALKALPDRDPSKENGTKRAARVRAEDALLRAMVVKIAAVQPKGKTRAAGLRGWTNDWSRMIDARDTYASSLEALASSSNPNARVRFIYPASNAITPITQNMDDYVRESTPRLNACFTTALQLEVVEGPRDYEKVTS